MKSIRDIRSRIKSIENTQKITRAMRMISAAKLAKAQQQVLEARPYADKIKLIAAHLYQDENHYDHPLLEHRKEGKVAYVLFSSERGLCGGYNINLNKAMDQVLSERSQEEIVLFPLGKKSREYFKEYPQARELVGFLYEEKPSYQDARILADALGHLVVDEGYKEVNLVYNRFVSAVTQDPIFDQILPIPVDSNLHKDVEYIFEPESKRVVQKILPKYMETETFRAMLEARASEHAARMAAMEGATQSADDIIHDLKLNLNRARQEQITNELAELVGGVEAQKKQR
ncbi:ATP synthase F1 subunit gamma [Clostridia bacterium]|nr:ATP synthase F1 subunit gamma [Clostridia bacterium]